jgi:peroxiredoxin
MMSMFFGTVLPWLLLAFSSWFGWQVLRQNGRFAMRLDAIEEQLVQLGPLVSRVETIAGRLQQFGLGPAQPAPPQGLPLGSPAPEFELPDITGAQRSLKEFRGRRVLVIFFNAHCDFCLDMAPDLAELPVDGEGGAPLPVILANGSLEDNQAMARDFGLNCPILLQQQGEVATRYQADGTPNGYLIDEEGRIASPKAVGSTPILALAPHRSPAGAQNGHSGGNGAAGANGDAAAGGSVAVARPPRLARQAWNLAQAMVEFVADGAKTLTEEQYSHRLEICDTCDRRQGNRCMECGCYLKVKARGRAFKCPVGKWPEVEI